MHWDGKKNDRKTIVTGANFVLNFPFPDRPALFNKLKLDDNEDLVYYDNLDDIFSEVLFVIESVGFKLRPSKHQAVRVKGDDTIEKAVINHHESNTGSTIAARWVRVLPGEKIVLFYSF